MKMRTADISNYDYQ